MRVRTDDAFTTQTDLGKFALMSVFCLQEDNRTSEVDEAYLRELMPSDHTMTLIRMLEGADPSSVRVAALARTWQSRSAATVWMSGSTD